MVKLVKEVKPQKAGGKSTKLDTEITAKHEAYCVAFLVENPQKLAMVVVFFHAV